MDKSQKGQEIARRIAPKLFPEDAILPLKVGIKDRLFEQCQSDDEKECIIAFLDVYCTSTAYIERLTQGGPRYNIRGEERGRITPFQQQDAIDKMELTPEEYQKKKIQKRKEYQARQKALKKARKLEKEKTAAKQQPPSPKSTPKSDSRGRPILSLKRKEKTPA